MRSARLVAVTAIVVLLPALTAAADVGVRPAARGDVVIAELANGGRSGPGDGFFELRNDADHAVALEGWSVYACDEEGLRAKRSAPQIAFRDVVLEPGERYTVAHMSARGVHADAVFSRLFAPEGFGVVLVSPDGEVADGVAVYPTDPVATQSECATENLPMTLAWALGESWQRTAAGAWIRAGSTPGKSEEVARATGPSDAPVRIEEIAAAGASGSGDDLVELRNVSTRTVALDGWRLYRCTAQGAASESSLQHVFASGASLAPGERVVVGGPGFAGEPDVRVSTSLADIRSGVLLTTAEGRRVDGLWVSSDLDGACQTGPEKLPATLDHRSGESWQLAPSGDWIIAPRTPGAVNAETEDRLVVDGFSYSAEGGVAISEFANDPDLDRGGFERHHFVELGNYGDDPVDVSGWRVIACGADGYRATGTLATIAAGTTLEPGRTWIAALRGSDAERAADAVFDTEFALAGAGVWIEDAAGRRVDSVGVYHRNEMDESDDRPSPCTKGLPLATFAVDRLSGETHQRVGFTGDDLTDFVAAAATPGTIGEQHPRDTDAIADDALARAVRAAPATSGLAGVLTEPRQGSAVAVAAVVQAAYSGAAAAPLAERSAPGETRVDPDAAGLAARDDAYDYPYLRLVIAADPAGGVATWAGRTVGRATVRLSVWNPDAAAWRVLDTDRGSRTASSAVADENVQLTGEVTAAEAVGGVAELRVQVVSEADPALATADGMADPDDYDLALSHLTDTQYYSEAYPDVYAGEVAWIAANARARKIAFATHTGDLIQNWVDPDQREDRARHEYEVASRMQRVLDDAGIPNSVLPGNHDNKRGVTNDLFNDYFPPSRYAGSETYGGSIAPDDNSANWSEFTVAGASFVMISLPYAYAEREIAWAETVIAAHPDANIVVSTHEHLTAKTGESDAERSTTSRWVSHGDLLWNRIVAPHRNVVLVLSGHFHGLGAIVTEDAGGHPGHTVVEALADYQEFRTPTGERATGFQRLLQLDLGSGTLAVDTFSVPLDATASHPYDYRQFVPDNGSDSSASNERPWNVLDRGLQHRYTDADDEFAVTVALQHPKSVETDAVGFAPSAGVAPVASAPAPHGVV